MPADKDPKQRPETPDLRIEDLPETATDTVNDTKVKGGLPPHGGGDTLTVTIIEAKGER